MTDNVIRGETMELGMLQFNRIGLLGCLAASVSWLAWGGASAHASVITSADIGKNLEYQQTDSSGTVTPFSGFGTGNAFFFARVFYDSGAYDGGSLSYNTTTIPFNSVAFDCCGSTGGAYQTSFISKSDMDSQFPTNTSYTLEVTDSTNTNPPTDIHINLPDDLYQSTPVPTFSAASFDALQLLTPGQGLTIFTSTFTPDPNATGGQTFLSIYDLTANTTVYSDFGANTRGSWNVGSGVFDAGHLYEAQLIFDNLVSSSDGGIPTTARSDLRTDVFFGLAAAVPEPGALPLLASGVGVLGALGWSRKRKRFAA